MFFVPVQGKCGGRTPGAALALAVVAAVAVVPGCKQEPEATDCGTGVYCSAGTRCAAKQAICILDDCGDGRIQGEEICDDGNVEDGDGCNKICSSKEICGNGIVDVKEVCDWALDARCADDCRSTLLCGNGITNEGEACDDGAETLTCNDNCTRARNGDGIVNEAAGELCDGGVVGGASPNCQSAACNANCRPAKHGDGIANPDAGEQCDGNNLGAGNGVNCESPFCNADCTWSRHGDGILNLLAGEQCDGGIPGGTSPNCQSADCNADCTLSRHGDGIVNPSDDGERCDGGILGGMSPSCESLTCTEQCTPSSCGDGIKNVTAKEACDDGNEENQDDCKSCQPTVCGDGIRNLYGPLHAEECDLGATLNGRTECYYGQLSCEVCTATCALPAEPAKLYYCGNGTQEVDKVDVNGAEHDEMCDDDRSFACGTCTKPACTTAAPAKARGRIEVKSTAVPEGTLITLGDRNMTFTVEVDMKNDGCLQTSPTAGCASVSDSTPELKQIAGAIRAEITRMHDLGYIPVRLRSTTNDQYVRLEHDLEGVIGNREITAATAAGTLAFLPMKDGVGCATGQECATDADCVTGTCLAATDTTAAVCE